MKLPVKGQRLQPSSVSRREKYSDLDSGTEIGVDLIDRYRREVGKQLHDCMALTWGVFMMGIQTKCHRDKMPHFTITQRHNNTMSI